MFPLSLGVRDLLHVIIQHHVRPVERPPAKPEPFVEHDPRKALRDVSRNVTPGHLLGAGGRAELFRIPE